MMVQSTKASSSRWSRQVTMGQAHRMRVSGKRWSPTRTATTRKVKKKLRWQRRMGLVKRHPRTRRSLIQKTMMRMKARMRRQPRRRRIKKIRKRRFQTRKIKRRTRRSLAKMRRRAVRIRKMRSKTRKSSKDEKKGSKDKKDEKQ